MLGCEVQYDNASKHQTGNGLCQTLEYKPSNEVERSSPGPHHPDSRKKQRFLITPV